MEWASLPVGFRFNPTDEELVGHYLKRKVEGLEVDRELIPVVNVYGLDPWELADISYCPNLDMECFFFSPFSLKDRFARTGYWKSTGKECQVFHQSSLAAYRRTLLFHRNGAPLDHQTDWLMHEYRLCEYVSQEASTVLGQFVLRHVIKRQAQLKANVHEYPKANVHKYPKANQVGDSSSTASFTLTRFSREPWNDPDAMLYLTNLMNSESNIASPITYLNQKTPMSESALDIILPNNDLSYWDANFVSSKGGNQGCPQPEFVNTSTSSQPCNQIEMSSTSSYSTFREEIDSADDVSLFGSGSASMEQGNYSGLYEQNDATTGTYKNDVPSTCLEKKGRVETSNKEHRRTTEISFSYEVLKQHFRGKLGDAAESLGEITASVDDNPGFR